MRTRNVFLSMAATALALAAVHAQSAFDAALQAEQKKLKAPALSAALLEKGKIVYAGAFGLADVENNVAATSDTRFRTASIAKPLTATAVLQLYERGVLDLDAPIQKYCPAFPAKPWTITARHLLGHQSGVRHYTRPGESAGVEHFFAIADSLKLFAGDPLLFEPGTKHSYSTYGFSVLGCAIEGASKMPYAEYMQTHVFRPAGMTRTTVDDVYMVIPQRARGYYLLDRASYDALPAAARAIASPGGLYNAPLHDTSMKTPGGGLLSTPSDLLMFAAALLDGRLLRPETRTLMWTAQKTADGKPTDYGLGWGVATSNGKLIVSHGGNQAGASSSLVIDATNHLALALMTNLEDADLGRVVRVLTGPLSPTGKYTSSAPPPTPSPLAANEYRLELQLGPTTFAGRISLDIAGDQVKGRMAIEQPMPIEGSVTGTQSGSTLSLRVAYTRRSDDCTGEVALEIPFRADREANEGTALVSGTCLAQPLSGTARLFKRNP